MDALINLSNFIGDIVWGPPFLILLIATGLYLTIRIGFFQFTHLGHAWKYTFGSMFKKDKEDDDEAGAITSFQSVAPQWLPPSVSVTLPGLQPPFISEDRERYSGCGFPPSWVWQRSSERLPLE